MSKLTDGIRLQSIWWADRDGGSWLRTKNNPSHEKNPPVEMVVVMENGQMAGVPWVVVTFRNGKILQYNLALVEGFEREQANENPI